MSARVSRRTLLKRTVATAAAAATAGAFPAPYLLARPRSELEGRHGPSSARSTRARVSVQGAATERLVALCDVDDKNLGKSFKFLQEVAPDVKTSSIKTFSDYRKMYDTIHKEVDSRLRGHSRPSPRHGRPGRDEAGQGGLRREAAGAIASRKCASWRRPPRSTRSSPSWATRVTAAKAFAGSASTSGPGAIGNVVETHSWAPTGRGGRRRPAAHQARSGRASLGRVDRPGRVPRVPRPAPPGRVAELVGVRRRLARRLGAATTWTASTGRSSSAPRPVSKRWSRKGAATSGSPK